MGDGMHTILLVIYLIAAVGVIGLVLVQHGKGADMGASFGAGASNTVFGSSGSGNFLSRSTAVLATLFFGISLALGAMTAGQEKQGDEWENLEVPVSEQAPAEKDVPGNQPTDIPD